MLYFDTQCGTIQFKYGSIGKNISIFTGLKKFETSPRKFLKWVKHVESVIINASGCHGIVAQIQSFSKFHDETNTFSSISGFCKG